MAHSHLLSFITLYIQLIAMMGWMARPTSTFTVYLSRRRVIRNLHPVSSSQSFRRTRVHLSSSGGSTTDTNLSAEEIVNVEAKIKAKGDQVRQLKQQGADKKVLSVHVEELLGLKARLDPSLSLAMTSPAPQPLQQSKQSPVDANNDESDYITARAVDYSKWYNDIIRVAGLAESSPVRGCMVIKPWGMSIWESVRDVLDAKIKRHGASNAYFPLLIPQSFLAKEAEHVDGFAKECAVVTHHRLKIDDESGDLIVDPDAQLEEPLIIRPTSETMIWYMFRKWIVSHRDLPLKINQWANVMRWELRTRPFLRTSEFLWQEGHTAHATAESAIQDAQGMIEQYASLCEDLLAMPVIRGVKSPSERFAGATDTYTIEALMPNGWALQSGTSHFLGQSFGKAFDVTFQDENGQQQLVWGTSWGASTRLIGALIMTHSDDAGLVLPPRVAPVQVIVVPIPPKKNDDETKATMDRAIAELITSLEAAGLRYKLDDRDNIRSGAKYFEWERKGVPLRIELGPRDVRNNVCIFKYRVGTGDKATVNLSEAAESARVGLEDLQNELYGAAAGRLAEGITTGVSYDDMKKALNNDEASTFPGRGLFLVPWKCDAENESKIKEECKATIRCYPLDANQSGLFKGKMCFYSGDAATHMALFGRAF